MEPDIKKSNKVSDTPAQEPTDMKTDPAGAIAPAEGEAWQEALEPVKEFLNKLPDYIGKFYSDYKDIITVVVIIIGAFITVKLTLALLAAINDLPLLAPMFEIIGIGYTAWFIYRYVWKEENRSELVKDFNRLKSEVLGGNSADS